ncbi:MAG: hypothetical protein SPL73_01695 [Cyanobacteriota bacterium]|nr:hypothetical protein [Cyanobacteriota bacterium]MDY6358176.1 hypothetical protein [Cyanobacteriota bacterium]MDY6363587.1 hypothetical protein [Cyanobacteriota bacterium]MDY6383554.1 hypothetical protein [Cyanobacteriota bacterium]
MILGFTNWIKQIKLELKNEWKGLKNAIMGILRKSIKIYLNCDFLLVADTGFISRKQMTS